MRHRRAGLVVAAVTGLVLALPAAAGAQMRQGRMQQDRMQQHREHMEQQMQRLDRMRERIHRLDQMLHRQMQMMRDQDRMRLHERLREMCTAMDAAAAQLYRNMERTRDMARDPLFQRDPELQREMERLRQHWEAMTEELEQGTAAMERIQKQLQGS